MTICFTIMSSDGLVYDLIFKWWLNSSDLFLNKELIVYYIHITDAVWRKWNILCIKFKIRTWRSLQLRWSPSYMSGLSWYSLVENTCMTASLQYHAHETSLTLPFFFIEVPVPSQENEPSYICVRWYRFYLSFYDFRTVPIMWYICFSCYYFH